MSKVRSGNNPVKIFYKFAGKINEGANMCLIRTWTDINFRTPDKAPPKKTWIIGADHNSELLIFFKAFVSI